MLIETRGDTEPQARSIRALIHLGIARDFPVMVEDGAPTWLCWCRLEDELLAFTHRNRWGGVLDGFRFVIGLAEGVADVPSYNEWGDVQCWLEYSGAVVTVELVEAEPCDYCCPQDDGSELTHTGQEPVCTLGLVVQPKADFIAAHDAEPLVKVPFADDSGIRLNRGLKQMREYEAQFGAAA
jgi:hypothetical protein